MTRTSIPLKKQLAYSLLAQHIANSKEEAQAETQAERKRLSNAFKTLPSHPIALGRRHSRAGRRSAIAALRGIIYQEGRNKRKGNSRRTGAYRKTKGPDRCPRRRHARSKKAFKSRLAPTRR